MDAGSMTHGQIAEALIMSRCTNCRWLSRDREGQSRQNRAGRSRMNSVSQVAKITTMKSVLKRELMAKILDWRLIASSHTT